MLTATFCKNKRKTQTSTPKNSQFFPPYHTMHVSIECRGTTIAHVLVDIGSSLNVLPKKALDRLDCEGLTLKPSKIVVMAFDGSKRMVHGEVDIPVKIGSQNFGSTF